MQIPFITTFTIMETIPHTSSQSCYHNPLFSSIVTFYILIVFCFPQYFLKIILSPLLISTLILLLYLLRLGASQQQQQQRQQQQQQPPSLNHGGGAKAPPLTQNDLNPIENPSSTEAKTEPEPNWVVTEPRQEVEVEGDVIRPPCNTTEAHATVEPGPGPEPEDKSLDKWARNQCLDWAETEPAFSPKLLVEWDVGAPLEVIYEAYEGEEEGEEAKNDAFWRNNEGCHNNKGGVLKRYPSLSRYYPESESDSDSDSESSSSMSWEGEYEDKEGLIEIALDYGFDDKKVHNVMRKVAEKEEFCLDDEDNFIEIDISPTKNMDDFAW